MAERKTYSDAEKAEYWKKRAQGGKTTKGAATKRSGSRSSSRKRASRARNGNYKKRSGCRYEESYIAGPNSKFGKQGERVDRPKIWGWRIHPKLGFQSFEAYLSKNDGIPKDGINADKCRVFVVNIHTKGIGTTRVNGVYNLKYRKLSMTKEELVANPNADNGGYFGRGGSRFKNKVK
ncbi:MAG: hypothetical protein EOO37_00085 [Cytophagaceae bacterium]|nr:MAG: hypothetical protein EOO37_00085 [Cytophagaceae bacterium]